MDKIFGKGDSEAIRACPGWLYYIVYTCINDITSMSEQHNILAQLVPRLNLTSTVATRTSIIDLACLLHTIFHPSIHPCIMENREAKRGEGRSA